MLTDSGAQNMPPANVFADMFKAALAPVLSQLTTLNENVSAVLLNEHEDSEEDGEAASNDRPAMSADMDADLSALLVSAGKDDNTEAMPGEDLLKEREDPSFADSYRPLRPFAKVWRLFLIICCQKRWGTRSSRPSLGFGRGSRVEGRGSRVQSRGSRVICRGFLKMKIKS